MTDETKPNRMEMLVETISQLDDIVEEEGTSAADKLKAIAMKVELLGLAPQKRSAKPVGDEPAFDPQHNESMRDFNTRRKAAKDAAAKQRIIKRAER